MRINTENLIWAIAHPIKTLRYMRWRDVIPCDALARHLPENPVILEAGAANGENTLEMAEFWAGARIHAFEPVPGARALLEEKTARFKDRVTIYPCALGDSPGQFEMNVSGSGDAIETQSSSLLTPTGHHEEYDFVKFGQKIVVDVLRMDDWAAENGVEQVDLLWLDMQGYELRALEAGRLLLKTVKAIHIEVHHRELYAGAPLYPDVRSWLANEGFHPVIDATFRVGGNVLFVRP